jgi:HIP---CoA ligase
MFIVGGFNCYPAEIERVIATCPGVAQVAVIGVPDERLGEVGVAFVVPREVPAPGWLDTLTAFCRERLANYKLPRRFELVSELPLNAAGKVVKTTLRARARSWR